MRMLKTVIIIAMVANVLMFATNAIQTKTAHADLDKRSDALLNSFVR